MTRILVIDDDESVRSAFAIALGSSPYELHCAADYEDGMTTLSRRGANLIFLDLSMPQCTGIDILRDIRRKDRVTPVFIVTSFAEELMPILRRAAAEGLDFNLLRKPLDVDEIQAAASAALRAPWRKEEKEEEGADTCSI